MADYKTSPEIELAAKIINYQKKAQENSMFNIMKAYISSAEKDLNAKDGQPDYSLLKKEDKQNKLADNIIDNLENAYEKTTGVNLKELEKKAPGQSEYFFKMQYGIGQKDIRNFVKQTKEKFTANTFVNQMQKAVENITQQHMQAATSDIEIKHLDDIVKYTGIDSSSINKKNMGHEDARNLLHSYLINDNEISKSWLKQQHYHVKKDDGKSKIDKKEPIGFKKAA